MSHALFDHLRCPHVGSQQDDHDKWHKNIVVENTTSVTRGIIAVYNDVHNMSIGCPPQEYRCRYHCRDPIVVFEPDARDAQNPDSQVGKADFSLEWTSCSPSDVRSDLIGKKDVSNKADERRDTDAYHQEGQQKHPYHAVPRPRFFINEKVHNGNDDADGDIEVRYIKIYHLNHL